MPKNLPEHWLVKVKSTSNLEPYTVGYRDFSLKSYCLNLRTGWALRPVAGDEGFLIESASLLVGGGDWPSHQQVWAGYK